MNEFLSSHIEDASHEQLFSVMDTASSLLREKGEEATRLQSKYLELSIKATDTMLTGNIHADNPTIFISKPLEGSTKYSPWALEIIYAMQSPEANRRIVIPIQETPIAFMYYYDGRERKVVAQDEAMAIAQDLTDLL